MTVPGGLTHAGGVVYRSRAGASEILLVSGSRPPHPWVLPKGHIDPGETPRETAEREIAEEAGVVARVEQLLRDVRVPGRMTIRFFLMRAEGECPPMESRSVEWFPPNQARVLLPFPELREMIADVARILVARDELPDVRDGLTRRERVVLTTLMELERERGGPVPTPQLYGRVLEHVDLSPEELQAILQKLGARR